MYICTYLSLASVHVHISYMYMYMSLYMYMYIKMYSCMYMYMYIYRLQTYEIIDSFIEFFKLLLEIEILVSECFHHLLCSQSCVHLKERGGGGGRERERQRQRGGGRVRRDQEEIR